MTSILTLLQTFKNLVLRVAEAGFAFVALIVLAYLLLGEGAGPYVTSVVANLGVLIETLTPQALVAVALAVGLFYFVRARL